MRVALRLALLSLTAFPAAIWLAPAWPAPAGAAETPGDGSASAIIAKAVEWAKWHDKQDFHQQWTFEHLDSTSNLNDSGEIQSTETRLYKVYPLAGEQFYELVLHNGGPLNAAQQRKEARRKREFLESANKSKSDEANQSDEEDSAPKFDQDLVSRFRAEVAGTEVIGGRDAYVLRFEPNSGPLPVRHRYDHVLNRSHGRLWIDREEFAVLKVEFELIEPVRLWAGLLGSVSRLRGQLTLTELGGGAWHYKTLDLYIKGRVFIKSFHENRHLVWRDFERVSPSEP